MERCWWAHPRCERQKMFPCNPEDTPTRSGNFFQASHRPWSSIVSCGKELSSARTANKPTQQRSERSEVRSTRPLRHLPRQSWLKEYLFFYRKFNQPPNDFSNFQESGQWPPNLNGKQILLEVDTFPFHLPPRSSEQRQSRSWFTNSIKEEAGRWQRMTLSLNCWSKQRFNLQKVVAMAEKRLCLAQTLTTKLNWTTRSSHLGILKMGGQKTCIPNLIQCVHVRNWRTLVHCFRGSEH